MKTILKNSAYKVQLDVVASTVGLNLEKGVIVWSEADAGYMACDGSAWAPVSGPSELATIFKGWAPTATIYSRTTTNINTYYPIQMFDLVEIATPEVTPLPANFGVTISPGTWLVNFMAGVEHFGIAASTYISAGSFDGTSLKYEYRKVPFVNNGDMVQFNFQEIVKNAADYDYNVRIAWDILDTFRIHSPQLTVIKLSA
jgi:hypothetical protein